MNFSMGTFEQGKLTILPLFTGQTVDSLGLTVTEYYAKPKDHVVYAEANGTRFVIVGLGDQAKFSLLKWRHAASVGVKAANQQGASAVTLLLPEGTSVGTDELVHVGVEGFVLGNYTFDKYKAKREEHTVQDVTVAGLNGSLNVAADVIARAEAYAAGTVVARDLCNEPVNYMRPYHLADAVVDLFKGTDAQVEIYKGDELVKRNMVGLLAVGRGSSNPPAMIKITLQTDATKPLTALVGKGVTFDTGGISLKMGRDISNMRMDMGGGAAVIGAMHTLVQLGAKVNVVALIPATENNPDGDAVLPGEIIQYPNGVTVHVNNTDAEGRLVLADGLILSQELGAERVVDIATLTGACFAALGTKLSGVWGEESLVSALKSSGEFTGDRLWEMPIVDEYDELIYSPIADMVNAQVPPFGGAIVGALFLRRFVNENQKWAHIDMAGKEEISGRASSFGHEGATGYGSRLLADWVISL